MIVITLCGSVKFKELFDKVSEELSYKGHCVLSSGMWGIGKYGYIDDSNPIKIKLELEHLRKIDFSEMIVVINKDGYVGKSTTHEIIYARNNDKTICWYNTFTKNQLTTNLIDMKKDVPLYGFIDEVPK